MTEKLTSRIALLLAATAPLLGAATPARAESATSTKATPQPVDNNVRVRTLFRKGAAAFEAGKNEEARSYLTEAWTIRQTYDVASSLAQVGIELGHYRDAAEHLDFCLRNFAPVESDDTLKHVQKAFAEVKRRVATVKVTVNQASAEVYVDAIRAGVSPLSSPVFLDPGAHLIAARTQAGDAKQPLAVEAGKEYSVDLTLSAPTAREAPPAPPIPTAAATPTHDAAPDAPSKNYAPAIAAASVGGATLITSVVFLFVAKHKADKRDDGLAQLPGTNQCGANTPHAETCAEIKSLNDQAHTFRTLSFVGFGVTAAAALGTYLLWPRNAQSASIQIHALALPTSAGLNFSGGLTAHF